MRNKQTIEYLICPTVFESILIRYKGTFTLSFKLHIITKNKTKTHGYPFMVNQPIVSLKNESNSFEKRINNGTVHQQNKFSFQSQSFHINYEQEIKSLNSQGVFRVEFQKGKDYDVILGVSLLRKCSQKEIGEVNSFCMKQKMSYKYKSIHSTQIILNHKANIWSYQKIMLRETQFFGSIDIFIGSFSYGCRFMNFKDQLSNFFEGFKFGQKSQRDHFRDMVKDRNKKKIKSATKVGKFYLDCNYGIQQFYGELKKVVQEHKRIINNYHKLLELKQSQNYIHSEYQHFSDLSHILPQKSTDLETLRQHYECHDATQIMLRIFEEQKLVGKNIRMVREATSTLLRDFHLFGMKIAKHNYEKVINGRVDSCVRFGRVEGVSREVKVDFQGENKLMVVNNPFYQQSLIHHPHLIIEKTEKQRQIQKRKAVPSITIMVHGYQGSNFDFQKTKNYIKKLNINTNVFIPQEFGKNMDLSIEQLGKKLADEVKIIIEHSDVVFNKINFIAFSLGGLIARAAFRHLEEYEKSMGIFITFSSPHMGISELDNKLVNLGVWYLINVDKVKNLKQLNFQSVKFKDSTLAKLSKCSCLKWFTKVVLVCSRDDGFVPFYSTMVDQDIDDRQLKDIARNFCKSVQSLDRVEVIFDAKLGGTFDKMLGRKAHIQFLDNDHLLQIFYNIYGDQL